MTEKDVDLFPMAGAEERSAWRPRNVAPPPPIAPRRHDRVWLAADWRAHAPAAQKIKKAGASPVLRLAENPDILAGLAASPARPPLLIGFAAETERVVEHATAKRARKGCDWIVANDVSGDVMGGEANSVHIVTADGVESWERLPKDEVAARLAARIAGALSHAACTEPAREGR